MHNIQKLRDLARECQSYQIERGLSDAKFCAKISQVGSSKTYKRILDAEDTLEELNVEKQLANFTAAVDYIKVLRTSERPAEPEYEEFSNVADSMVAIARALNEESIARFVVIEGENGTGKDAVRNALIKRWSKIVVSVEATDIWKNSPITMLGDIINAIGVRRSADESGEPRKLPMWPSSRLEMILEELRKRKLILLINEGHHCGDRCLNHLKTIINQTPTVVVLECIPALLTRLIKESYQESIQLFGNRLCERVRLSSPPQDEIRELMERRGVKFVDTATENVAAINLATEAPDFGNWRYVVQVTREALAASNGKPLSARQFSDAQSRARQRRITINNKRN